MASEDLAQLYAQHGEFVPVRSHSPAWLRKLWYTAGRLFEPDYDGRWIGDTPESNYALREKTHGYLIVGERGRTLGALCVRWIKYVDEPTPPGWSFEWAWVVPSERGRGHLRRAWEMVRATYGDHVMWTAKDARAAALAARMSSYRP